MGERKMFGFLKNRAYPIGVDVGPDSLKLAQLANGAKSISLIAGDRVDRPEDVKPGSVAWQRWAIEAVREALVGGDFHGKEVTAAVPSGDVFIDEMRMPKTADGQLKDAIFAKIKQQLPFQPSKKNTLIKYISTDRDNILVMATERRIIDIHLAIYERAGLVVKSIGVWPIALANCYARFFGRRKDDLDVVVMLLDIEATRTNLVICRHKNPLFACSIPIGADQLTDEKVVTRLVLELTSCRRSFASLHRNTQIERLIFLSGRVVSKDVCTAIAKQLEIQAQAGDCLAAVEMADHCRYAIDRRNGCVNWAVAFGLSLS
jgi:Tfp pilus assembly PilM family ATPase